MVLDDFCIVRFSVVPAYTCSNSKPEILLYLSCFVSHNANRDTYFISIFSTWGCQLNKSAMRLICLGMYFACVVTYRHCSLRRIPLGHVEQEANIFNNCPSIAHNQYGPLHN